MINKDKPNSARAIQGTVVSNKMEKTIVVKVERRVKNTLGKYIYRSTKIHAHDENNICQIGDEVLITQSKPRAKHKSWDLVSKIEDQAKG